MIKSCCFGNASVYLAQTSPDGFPAKYFISLLLISILSFLFPVHGAEEVHTQGVSLSLKNTAEARHLLDSAEQELSNLPEASQANEFELHSRITWQRRIELLEEYITQADALLLIEQQQKGLAAQLDQVSSQLKTITALPAGQFSTESSPTDHGFLESQLNEIRNQRSDLLAKQAQQHQLETKLPELLQATQRRYQEAVQREAMLSKSNPEQNTEAERLMAEKQIENVQLDRLVALQTAKLHQEQLHWYQQSEPLVQLKLELAEQQINRLEQQLASYHQTMQQQLAIQVQQAEQALIKKEQSAQEAATPDERFIATWEAHIARSEKSTHELQAILISLDEDVKDQEKRFTAEKDEFLAIKNLISSSNTYGIADRMRLTLQQIRQRRDLLFRTLRDDRFKVLNHYRERRFAIADSLFGLTALFEQQQNEIANQLSEPERQHFLTTSQTLLYTYRNTLRDEKVTLTEVISLGQKLQLLTGQRIENLNEFERFIRSTSFWIRDTRPLGWQTLTLLPTEILQNASWFNELTSHEVRLRLADAGKTPLNLLYTFILFLILPLGLYHARTYIRGLSRRINERVLAEGKLLHLAALVVITALLSSALLPAYFYVVARLAESARLPAGISIVCSQVFDHLALFLFFWFLSRSLFARRSISEVQFGLPHSAANALYAALKWFLFGYLIWLLPWNIFRQPPFENEALPRILYTLFLITSAIGVYQLTRSNSAFVQYALNALHYEPISRNWKSLSGLLLALTCAVLLLDIAGHRYASVSITLSLAGSLVLLIVLPPLYRFFRGRINSFIKHNEQFVAEPYGDLAEHPKKHTSKSVKVFRVAFIILAVILFANLWGIDEQALLALDDMQLYSVRIAGAEPEFVTLGNIVRCMLFFLITIWIIRGLPGLFNVWVLPRWDFDAGIQYAILTISRYTVFLVGFFFALAELHLDLGRLGWLMAAIGVGLGFGLQEIVSNFVSGLILLVERPVKPGDTVTIGNLSGTVSRINIRATTIVNFDRQEVMVPNRSLITNDVINWTRSDTVNRVVVSIGVAYGSNVDHVSELLMKIAAAQPEILSTPAPSVIFMQHGESSLDFDLRVFVSSPDDIMPIRDRLNRSINKTLAKEGIEIPFPQRDLHIRSSDLGIHISNNEAKENPAEQRRPQ